MTLAPASDFDQAALAAVFTAGYEGYFVPLQVDEAALRYMVDAWDIDLGRSRVAVDGAEPAHVNVPEGDVASVALARLGGTLELRQFELRLTRAPVSE